MNRTGMPSFVVHPGAGAPHGRYTTPSQGIISPRPRTVAAPDPSRWPVARRSFTVRHPDAVSLRRLQWATRRAIKAARKRVPWPATLRCKADWEDVPGPEATSAFGIEIAAPEAPERFLDRAEAAFTRRFESALARPRWLAWLG